MKDDKVEVDAELVIKNLLESLPDAKANQSLQTEIILAEYNLTKAKFNSMTKTRDFIMKKARIRSKLQMTLGLGALVGYFNFVAIGTYVRWSWDIVEPFAYFLNLAGIILLTSRYFKLKDDYENSTYQEYLANKNFKKIAVRFQFDEAEYNSLKKQLNDQKNKLKISLLIDL